jgi:ABC-type multidrug transport system permease subunit
MIEPVALKDFFVVFFSGAMVIMAGALYALLFAWSRLQSRVWMMLMAYAAYGLLVISVLTLGSAAHLNGFWWWLVIAMLAGYLLAPHAIWKLCVGTHAQDASVAPAAEARPSKSSTEVI